MLTSKQRAQLRSLSNSIETIFQIGKGGISDALIKQIMEALEKRELIKLRILENSPVSVEEAAQDIAEKSEAELVFVIGSRFVLYKKSKEKEKNDAKNKTTTRIVLKK